MSFKVGDLVQFNPPRWGEGEYIETTNQQDTLNYLKSSGVTAGLGPWRVVGRMEGVNQYGDLIRIIDPASPSAAIFTFLESRFSRVPAQLSLF